jgi:hypothetical protein
MQEIAELLAELSRMDRSRRIFGAGMHGYRTHRASESELRMLESRLGITLPAEYRALLSEIGSGAGPYYGLWSPAKVWEEFGYWQEDRVADGDPPISPAGPWPLGTVPSEECAAALFPCDGSITIAHQGCTSWSVLVTTGPFEGTVWDAACYVGFDGEYMPARRAPGILASQQVLPALARPSRLLDWYAAWLEQALADARAAQQAAASQRSRWWPW